MLVHVAMGTRNTDASSRTDERRATVVYASSSLFFARVAHKSMFKFKQSTIHANAPLIYNVRVYTLHAISDAFFRSLDFFAICFFFARARIPDWRNLYSICWFGVARVKGVFHARVRYFRLTESKSTPRCTNSIAFADTGDSIYSASWWIVSQSKVEIDRHERHLDCFAFLFSLAKNYLCQTN